MSHSQCPSRLRRAAVAPALALCAVLALGPAVASAREVTAVNPYDMAHASSSDPGANPPLAEAHRDANQAPGYNLGLHLSAECDLLCVDDPVTESGLAEVGSVFKATGGDRQATITASVTVHAISGNNNGGLGPGAVLFLRTNGHICRDRVITEEGSYTLECTIAAKSGSRVTALAGMDGSAGQKANEGAPRTLEATATVDVIKVAFTR